MVNTNNVLTELKSLLDGAVLAHNNNQPLQATRLLYDARVKLYKILSASSQPDFTVKATDPNAPAVVLYWISLAYEGEVAREKRKKAMAHYEQLVDWQEKNPTLVKKPD